MSESNRSRNHREDAHRKKRFQLFASKALLRLALASSIRSHRRTMLQEFAGVDDEPPCRETQAKRECAATARWHCHLFDSQVHGKDDLQCGVRALGLKPTQTGFEPG